MKRILISILTMHAVVSSAEEKRYIANYVTSAPVIDGRRTTDDEWRQASRPADGWTLLRSPRNETADETINRFSAVWNSEGLYLLHEVNYDRWANDGLRSINLLYENLNFFFDPNTDNETNPQSGANDTGIDGYQLVFNQPLGESVINATDVTAGLYREAHVNSLFGDQGAPWSGFNRINLHQRTDVEAKTGYTELFIPWSQFNATNPAEGFDPKFGDDIGLYHPEPPIDGEEWFFNAGRIQSDGKAPVWSAGDDTTYFAQRPHGVLEFKMSAAFAPTCDVNEDDVCNAADIDRLSAAILQNETAAMFDLNLDGQVNRLDRITWIKEPDFMNTYVGDADLADRRFTTSDFVSVFIAGEYEDDQRRNSGWAEGDWNGDQEFTSSDFVEAFVDGGYELPQRPAVNAVPEPGTALTGWLVFAVLIAMKRMR